MENWACGACSHENVQFSSLLRSMGRAEITRSSSVNQRVSVSVTKFAPCVCVSICDHSVPWPFHFSMCQKRFVVCLSLGSSAGDHFKIRCLSCSALRLVLWPPHLLVAVIWHGDDFGQHTDFVFVCGLIRWVAALKCSSQHQFSLNKHNIQFGMCWSDVWSGGDELQQLSARPNNNHKCWKL